MSISSDYFFYADVNYVDTSNVLSNYMNLTHNTNNSLDLSENTLSKYARGIFFSPNYNKQFFDAINWANNLGDYKTQLNLINPYNNNVLENLETEEVNKNIIGYTLFSGGMSMVGDYADHRFGEPMVISGDGLTIVAGSAWSAGYADVRAYMWNGTSWERKGTDIHKEAETTGNYGQFWNGSKIWEIAINTDGSRVATTSRYGDEARVFKWNGTDWEQIGNTLTASSDLLSSADGAISIAISGDGNRIAVGVFQVSANALVNMYGRVYVFDYDVDQDTWNKKGTTIYHDNGNNNWWAWNIAMSTDGMIIASGNRGDPCIVRTFEWDDNINDWTKRGGSANYEIVCPSGHSGGFPFSMSADGSRIAIGSPTPNGQAGYAQLWEWSGSTWNEVGQRIIGEYADSRLGRSTSLSADGRILAIGSQMTIGKVEVYKWDDDAPVGNEWKRISGNFSGELVALSDDGTVLAIADSIWANINSNTGLVKTYFAEFEL